MTTVAVVDDHALLATVLASDLERHGLRADVIDVDSSILSQIEQLGPDVVLLDLELGEDRPRGVDLIESITELDVSVVVLSGVSNDETLATCLERGAAGILAKDTDFDELTASIDAALRGEDVSPPAVERVRLSQALVASRRDRRRRLEPFARLTATETHVLEALMEGQSAADVSESSVVSLSTVRSHIKSILSKLDVGSQLQAVVLAHESKWDPHASRDA